MSCSLTANEPITDFQTKLHYFENKLRETEGPAIVGRDVNTKAVAWSMVLTNGRVRRILKMTSRLGFNVSSVGTMITFIRPGYGRTVLDITLASESIARDLLYWQVIVNYTGSDY